MFPTASPTTISLADIDKGRADIFKRLLSKVLHHDIVNYAFAQIIDGLPTKETHEFIITCRGDLMSRTEISQDSKERARKFCSPGRVAQLYQHASLDSNSFNMHLLELVAIAIHGIAGNLYTAFHPDGGPPPPEDSHFAKNKVPLSSYWYHREDTYPKGILDVVGYWAKTHIFGGMVVFDRGPKEEARDCRGVYLSPRGRSDLFALSTSQLEEFIRQGYDRDDLPPLTLPFACLPEAKRVNPRTAMRELNIYRDRYELGNLNNLEEGFADWCGGARRVTKNEEAI